MHAREQQSTEMRDCIDNCTACHYACLETVTHCLMEGGRHAEAAHIRLLIDCAEICQTSANFMVRGSDMHQATCRACAELCERCAESCAQFTDDEFMLQCAQICRRCAESCRRMAGMAAAV
jgi:hypothetical protein